MWFISKFFICASMRGVPSAREGVVRSSETGFRDKKMMRDKHKELSIPP
jgi:hypothetical protein